LTEELIRQAGRFIAIEKDARLCRHLRDRLPGLELVAGDATKVPLPACDKVVANLPYSVSTPVLERLVENEPRPRRMVLMLQREVASRLVATPRHKDYGALTLFTQLRYHVTIAHIVSPSCFHPAPQVESAVIVFDRREPRVTLLSGAPFHELVRAGFAHRRKMLRSQLHDFGVAENLLRHVGAVPTARAEELSLDQWITLANAVRR
jgi:16S rRNA (adenine1518-N6/adenine1519-N6)-dimethyltransferase